VIRPEALAHADWSVHHAKRWLARAILQSSGRYRALPPEPVGTLDDLLVRLGGEGRALLGVDFPIGLPRAYAKCAGIEDFVAFLTLFGDGRWRDFYRVARHASEICVARPFYPHHAGGKGTVARHHLLHGLGMAESGGLRRRCDRATRDRRAASPLFWTLGPNQVGKAAISGWRDLLAPALHAGLDLAIWPFQGPLEQLLTEHRYVVAETYPAEIYRHLGLPLIRPGGGSKRRQASRTACAPAMLAFAHGKLDLDPRLESAIRDGFGSMADGEDPFDATVGLLGLLNVALGGRPTGEPDDPAITRIEGWILGQAAETAPPHESRPDAGTPADPSRRVWRWYHRMRARGLGAWRMTMRVKDVMTSPVQVVEPDMSVVAAADRMRDANVGSLPVGEGDRLLGMITDRDIVVRCVADGIDCHMRTVRDVMSAELLVCFEDQPVEEASRLMTEYQVRRLPVLDQKQRLVGILSLDDLSGVDLRTRPRRVVFYKTLTASGAGQSRNVPLAIVHITDRHARDEVEAAAIRKFEQDRGIDSWTRVADGYELLDPA
jgi:CBS domain-containing protein